MLIDMKIYLIHIRKSNQNENNGYTLNPLKLALIDLCLHTWGLYLYKGGQKQVQLYFRLMPLVYNFFYNRTSRFCEAKPYFHVFAICLVRV